MKIWEPTKCCCCCNVRTGSIVLAILFLVGASFNIIGGVKTLLVGGSNPNIREICEDAPDIQECVEEIWRVELGMTITSLVISSFHIVFSSLLLHGILKKKTSYFVPLLTVYAIQIGLMILIGVGVIFVFLYFGIPFAAVFFFVVFYGLIVFLQTYFLLVIRAHYYEIKREKGHIHTVLTEQNQEAPPYPTNEVPPYSPPYPGNPYPGSQVPPYPSHEVPPYPSHEVPPYAGCDTPLYPDLEKTPK